MKNPSLILPRPFRALLAFVLLASPLFAVLNTFPAPASLPGGLAYTNTYSVRVRGVDNVWRTLAVYDADPANLYQAKDAAIPGWDPGAFVKFDSDETVTVEVTYGSAVSSAVVHPKTRGIVPTIAGNKVTFPVTGHGKLGLDINGNVGRPLWLFIQPPEVGAPSGGGAGVFYVAPGTVHQGDVNFANYSTVHVAGGAVLKGQILGLRTGGKVSGRGIVLNPAENKHALWVQGDGLTVEGLTFIGQSQDQWSCGLIDVDGATVRHISVLGIVRDGFNPIGVSRLTIEDSFFHSYDDAIAIKAKSWSNNQPCEEILIRRCVLWNHGVVVGFESQSDIFRDITIEDCDIIRPRSNMASMPGEPYTSLRVAAMGVTISDRAAATNITWRNIRIHDPVDVDLFIALVAQNYASSDSARGSISGVRLENIQVLDAAPGQPREFILEGHGPSNRVNNVTVDGLTINGLPVLHGYGLGAWVRAHVGTWSIVGGDPIYAPINEDVALVANSNGRYVSTGSTGTQPLVASATSVGARETYRVLWDSTNRRIGLRNNDGLTVQLANGGATPSTDLLRCVNPNFNSWEKFTPFRRDDPTGPVIITGFNGRNFQANADGVTALRCANTNTGDWEKFFFQPVVTAAVPAVGQLISLRGHHGSYLCSENPPAGGAGVGNPLRANRASVNTWERFTVVAGGTPGTVALRASSGLYVSAENGAFALRANRATIGANERFRFEALGAGKVALLAESNGLYVGYRYHAPHELWADRAYDTQENLWTWTAY